MNIEEFRNYCINKSHVSESFPFDDHVLVFKVDGKIFSACDLRKWENGTQFINLKCNPEKAIELRTTYEGIVPGYHMNKNARPTRCDSLQKVQAPTTGN